MQNVPINDDKSDGVRQGGGTLPHAMPTRGPHLPPLKFGPSSPGRWSIIVRHRYGNISHELRELAGPLEIDRHGLILVARPVVMLIQIDIDHRINVLARRPHPISP